MTERTRYTDLIRTASHTYGLPFDLLEGQILQESSGDPNACRYEPDFFERYLLDNRSAKGFAYGPFAACSVGLLQIIVQVAYEIGFDGRPEQLWDPKVGLAWGCRQMQILLAWTGGDYAKTLAAYNGGRGITRTGPPYPNQKYVNSVIKLAGRKAA